MDIVRSKPVTPHTVRLAGTLDGLQGPCVGCTDCTGLCAELIDALVIPEVILSRKRESQ
ncbi:hypothetical protein [Albibacillus kandeliae]|jgi:hypothetical protein|uniref:hypothetical protein n=1 Tax=Albibacillus kandeliae TaxID=2174228 RepID=UPI0018E58A44|nr:hypothetical protein [Albibacillus kandeliae]